MSINNQLDEIIDFKQFFFKIINNWYFFVLSLMITFLFAFAYNRYTDELYKSETTILINEDHTISNPSDLYKFNAAALFSKTVNQILLNCFFHA